MGLRVLSLLALAMVGSAAAAATSPAQVASIDAVLREYNSASFRQAAQLAGRAAAAHPLSPDAHHLLCASLLALGEDWARAMGACRAAVRLAPTNPFMRNTLGEVLRSTGYEAVAWGGGGRARPSLICTPYHQLQAP